MACLIRELTGCVRSEAFNGSVGSLFCSDNAGVEKGGDRLSDFSVDSLKQLFSLKHILKLKHNFLLRHGKNHPIKLKKKKKTKTKVEMLLT